MTGSIKAYFLAMMRTIILLCAFFCLTYARAPPINDTTYSDWFVRNKLFPLAAGAYSDQPVHCLNKMYRNAQFLRGLVASCDSFSVTKCYAFLALLHEEKAVAIGFRGSNDALQLLAQGGSVFNDMQEFMAGGFVSSYFFNAFSALWNDSLNDEFVKLRAQYPDYQVWIAGHSLGGAIANMCASHIVAGGYIEPGNVKLATFGEPRTGDKYYAAAHDILLPYTFRITHYRDLVIHLPLQAMGYQHHSTEIYYKASMKYGAQYKVCKELEDSRCSNGLWFANSIDDHTSYFEVSVSGYGIRGCT